MTDFQLLIWCGREVMGTSVSDAKGECVVVAMADTKSTHHPLLVVTIFGFFFFVVHSHYRPRNCRCVLFPPPSHSAAVAEKIILNIVDCCIVAE